MQRPENLGESFLDLRGNFQCKGVEALRKVTNILQKLVVKNNGRNGGYQAGSGGEERFRNTGCDSAQARGSGGAESREGVDDAPHGAEESDERRDGTGGGEPGHAFFSAANLFRGGQLHINRDGLEAFQFAAGIGVAGSSANLALEFTIAKGVNGGVRGAGGGQGLGVGDAVGGAKNAKKLIAFAFDAAEEAKFLEDHGPRDDGEDQEKRENSTGDPSGLFENASDIGQEERGEQKNGFTPQ